MAQMKAASTRGKKFNQKIKPYVVLQYLLKYSDENNMRFEDFPRGSCGETCYLLAEYLLEHNIYTEYVCGTKWPQSHAWLVVTTEEELEQKRIAKNKKRIVVSEHSNGYEYMNKGRINA